MTYREISDLVKKSSEIDRKKPIGCKCINAHDKGVILAAISNSIVDTKKIMERMKSLESMKRNESENYKVKLNDYNFLLEEYELVIKKVSDIPTCEN
jgi:isopropylmalate/homocitrate/citramalate synthase